LTIANLIIHTTKTMNINVSTVVVKTANGTEKPLGDYKGQVLLIVNVASRCGFTKQYAGLQALQDKYGLQGLKVLGFPCNDFGGQEPGSLEEIKTFCKTNFNATFEIFEKVHAKDKTTEPYTTLTKAEPVGDVKWNFEKFLISKSGKVIARFPSAVDPHSNEMQSAIERALSE